MLWSRPSYALFGMGDWFSGQNAILAEILAAHIEELTKLTTLIANVQVIVRSTNEALSVARSMKRAYDMVRNYRLEDLGRDAKAGLFRAMPELRDLERETAALIGNADAAGEGAFFSHTTHHDRLTDDAVKRVFEHGYQASIWPMLFPEAMSFHRQPTPVEVMVQSRYRRTQEGTKRAVQRTALSVLAKKVEAFVEDAEAKDHVGVKSLAANAQINLQNLQNSTELLNLRNQDVAVEEAAREDEEAFRHTLSRGLKKEAQHLTRVGGFQ
jgi:hypothetical protein